VDYGCLFWAEQRVPSGIAAVVLATIPVFITLLEIIVLRTQRLTVRLGLALLLGLCGVAVLTGQSFSFGEVPINRAGALALLVASVTWSVATVLTRRLPLPDSKPMSAAAQMITGGVQLFVLSAVSGEFQRLSRPNGFLERVVRIAVFNRRRFDRRLHCLCLAAALRIAHESWNLRLRKSRGPPLPSDISSQRKRLARAQCWEPC